MTLDEIPSGQRTIIDANIFIYHFTGNSEQCRRFLRRCEDGDLRAATSALVVAEVAHRLMMLEAVERELVTPGQVANKLRSRPEVVRQLRSFREQAERIPLIGVDVAAFDIELFLRSATLREQYGLLTDDSLIAATALRLDIRSLATADEDFTRIEELDVYRPSDIG